jgi:DNA-directed RNA polymerase beta' subunit
MKIMAKKRITEINNRSLKQRGACSACSFVQPIKWIAVDNILIRPVWATTVVPVPVVTPSHVYTLLHMVDTRTADLLGFRGSMGMMMVHHIPIPPILMRPNRSSRAEDDLSMRLRAIIQANTTMYKADIGEYKPNLNLSLTAGLVELAEPRIDWKPRHKRNKKVLVPEHLELYFDLQRQCAGFQDSKYCPKNDLDYGRELSSVRHRFVATKHRRGRIRANILGKRGDFTARAVASPNTYIDPHEVGVPLHICRHLTIKERVFAYNYTRMQFLVLQGPDRYPGANYVERNGERFLLPLFCENGLQMGDIVHRHMQKGDVVIMNRQPSLHRYSMMGYRVVPMQCNTFQLHLSVTSAHNLDFDGDEVNLFLSGSIEANAEIKELMTVDKNMFKDGRLLVGFVQHSCLAAYILTRDADLLLSPEVLHQLLFVSRLEIVVPDTWNTISQTGRQVMTFLLPTYDGTCTLSKSKMNRLASVYLTKSGLSTLQQSRWVGGMVRFLEEFLLRHGSTLSYADCTSTQRDTNLIDRGLQVISMECDETLATKVADRLRDVVGTQVYTELVDRTTNNLVDVVESGAKGNRSHIVQNVGMVGQQFDGNSNRHAILQSHDVPLVFKRGFASSSFSDGLGPVEFFHHLVSSRHGLVGTAVSTAETGYCYRRISKCLEDIRIGFDHSIRTAFNGLIMPIGGFSTDYIYSIPIRLLAPGRDFPAGGVHERFRLQQIQQTLRNQTQGIPDSIELPFDIVQDLPKVSVDDTGMLVTADDIYTAVGELWTRLCRQNIPPEVEVVLFDYLSSNTLQSIHGVRTWDHLMRVINHVEHSLCRALYPPGTPIGLIVSQSFSEPLTQIQLNRFHHSGEGSGLVNGVSRIKEIINCMKTVQTPSMTIVPLDDHACIDYVDAILCVTFDMVMRTWSTKRPGYVTILLNRDFMCTRRLTPRIVAIVIGTLYPNVQHTVVLSDVVWQVWFPLKTSATTVLDVRATVKTLTKLNPVIRGVRNVLDFYFTTIDIDTWDDNGIFYRRKKQCIVTKGTNLETICQLPWVDVAHTTTNDLMELYSVFGIDAMCTAIEHNLLQVMTSNSAHVSRRYISVIAHEMCRTGSPCALTFVGLTQSETSTLKLATFERSLESFVRAACSGHEDKLRGISESVIVGKPVSVGTGGDFELCPTDCIESDTSTDLSIPADADYVYPPIPRDITTDLTTLPIVTVARTHKRQRDRLKDDPSLQMVKRPKTSSSSSTLQPAIPTVAPQTTTPPQTTTTSQTTTASQTIDNTTANGCKSNPYLDTCMRFIPYKRPALCEDVP